MPTQTFFNLQSEKQNKIINASKNEFSKYNFYEASINRIIKDAGISRGSFYQYFENKEDVFIYLLNQYKFNMLDKFLENIDDNKHDIFEFLLLVYDFITVDTLKSEDKDFIITTISNMDVKLVNHLFGFLDVKNLNKHKSYFNKLVNWEALKINDLSDMIALNGMLMSILMNQVVIYFNCKQDRELCREHLLKELNFIKYGVAK